MKCQKANTDQACEVTISCGDKLYPEYILDPATDLRPHKPNVFECFIPIAEGEQITVNIDFRGTVLHGAADILADGAFVFDRRIEGDKRGTLKFQKRDWKLKEFYNVPGGTDTEAMHTGTAIVAGQLLVKSLDEDEVPLYVKNGGKLGLGSLAVIVSVNQDTEEMYQHKYQHQTVGKWRQVRGNHADGGIKPAHELEFVLDDDEVHFNRQQRHRRHLEQLRFGMKPWAVFVFHYRSQTAIQQAGCVALPDKYQALEPFLGEFTFADPDAIMKKRLATRARNERRKAAGAEHDFDYDGNASFGSRSMSGSEGLFVSRSPSQSFADAPKKKLFGNSLGLPSAQPNAPRKDSGISQRFAATAPQNDAPPVGDWRGLFGDDARDDNSNIPQQHQGGGEARQLHNNISGGGLRDDFDFDSYPDLPADQVMNEIDEIFAANEFDFGQAPGAAPVATMAASSPSQTQTVPHHQHCSGDVVQSVESDQLQQHQSRTQSPQEFSNSLDEQRHAEPNVLSQMISSAVQHKVDEQKAAKAARIEAKATKKERPPPAPKGKPIFDPTAKTGYGYGNPKTAPKLSMGPTQQAMQQLSAQNRQIEGMLRPYLQDQDRSRQYAKSPNQSPQSATYTRPWETAQSKHQAENLMSPPNKVAHAHVTVASAPVSPQSAQASHHTPASAIQRKRSASITSRESTPGKRARGAEIEARRAVLFARLQETNEAKEAAQKQLEEQRRAREELERRREEEERMAREEEERKLQEEEERKREEEEERIARDEEEREEAELAALEAQLEGADAEVEAIREQAMKEAEEARMKEVKRQLHGKV